MTIVPAYRISGLCMGYVLTTIPCPLLGLVLNPLTPPLVEGVRGPQGEWAHNGIYTRFPCHAPILWT